MFGRFAVDPVTCSVFRDGLRLPLSERLFTALLYLVEHHGRVVERDELLQALWPGRRVEESNLPRAISSLRLALKDQEDGGNLIATVPGRGYRFGEHVLFEPVTYDAGHHAGQEAPGSAGDVVIAGVPMPVPRSAPPAPRLRGLMVPLASAACTLCIVLSFMVWKAAGVSGSAWPLAAPARSIAVLPFVNRSHDAKLDVLSDGISEELINALGRIRR